MTAIEKAVKTVSDLHDFYRRIPKIGGQEGERDSGTNKGPLATERPTPGGGAGRCRTVVSRCGTIGSRRSLVDRDI